VQNNKTVVLFLAKFFGTYVLLFLLYTLYLNTTQKSTNIFTCAPITKTVAKQTSDLLNFLGYTTKIEQHEAEVSIKLFINNKFVARIIEGCNSISIIILFVAFIVAFASSFKITALYILFGSFIIYSVNIFRMAIISIALFEYPEYEKIIHDIIFPSIIYGITFLLWFIWVRYFSKLKK
jgi:exosortase family protein XrtF